MSLLALRFSSSNSFFEDPPVAVDSTPYPMPTAAPWNAPVYAVTPTPDGSGSAVHPSVMDFGSGLWNGKRFWMAVTPYLGSDDQKENPAILSSTDGFTWAVPAGLVNPIDPAPGSPNYNSDTELYYDAPSGKLYCFWRQVSGSSEIIYRSWSLDGITWSAKQVAVTSVSSVNLLSPSIRKLGNTFYLWTEGRRLSATAIDGTFGSAQNTVWNGQGGATIPGSNWHVGMEVVGTEVWSLINKITPYKTYAAKSVDGGLTFTVNPIAVIEPSASGWDNNVVNGTYRATFQVKNSDKVKIWYSAESPSVSWRVGYTKVPRSLWANIV